MKRVRSLESTAALLAAVLLFAGCGDGVPDDGAGGGPQTSFAELGAPDQEYDDSNVYWYGTELDAEDVRYYQTSNQIDGCVVKQDGKYGVIRYNGEWLLAPQYESIEYRCTYNWIERDNSPLYGLLVDAHKNTRGYETVVLEDGGLLTWDPVDACLLVGEERRVFWDLSAEQPVSCEQPMNDAYLIEKGSSKYWSNTCALGTYCRPQDTSIIAVQSIDSYEAVDSEYYRLVGVSQKYGLLDRSTNRMLTGFVYDDVAACGFIEGVLPVKMNGKWGYVDETGAFLAPCVYEASAVEDGKEQMYSACNGYIIIRGAEGYGLMDTKGRIVLKPVYEDLTQANPEGLLWVKSDGKWRGVSLNGRERAPGATAPPLDADAPLLRRPELFAPEILSPEIRFQ